MFWQKTEKFCKRDFFRLSSDGFIKSQGGYCWNLLKRMSSNIQFVTFLGKAMQQMSLQRLKKLEVENLPKKVFADIVGEILEYR